MKVKAWNNGQHSSSGAGYGIKISVTDRDQYFDRKWKTIMMHLEGESEPVEVNVDKPSFWNDTCRELISQRIGGWILAKGLAPWKKVHPPDIELIWVEGNRFTCKSF